MKVDSDIAPKTKEEGIAYLNECINKINKAKENINKMEQDDFEDYSIPCRIADVLFEIEHNLDFLENCICD